MPRLHFPFKDTAGERFEFDPSYAAIQGPYTAVLNDYLRRDLIFEYDIPYEILANLYENWSYDKFENQFVNSNASVEGIAHSLASYYLLHGDINLINTELEIYNSITPEEIRNVAKKYLNSNQRLELHYLPSEKTASK